MKPQSPHAAKIFPSPNHNERKAAPDMLLLHYTGMPDSGEALQWLCNPVSQVSCHYFVFEDGHILQLVPEERRAWHAGQSFWKGKTDINSCSIGIEIANPGHGAKAVSSNVETGLHEKNAIQQNNEMPDYPEAQISSLILLCQDIVRRWNIAPERVLAHSDVAPMRKSDPGERFPWKRLHQAGIGHYVSPAPVRDGRFFMEGDEGAPIEALQAIFAFYGYDMPITGSFCEKTKAVITAFQRHFRSERVDGIADLSTIQTSKMLLEALP